MSGAPTSWRDFSLFLDVWANCNPESTDYTKQRRKKGFGQFVAEYQSGSCKLILWNCRWRIPQPPCPHTGPFFLVLTGSLKPQPIEAVSSGERTSNFRCSQRPQAGENHDPTLISSWGSESRNSDACFLPPTPALDGASHLCSSALGHTGAAELGPLLTWLAAQQEFERRSLAPRVNRAGRHLPSTKTQGRCK